MIARLIAPWRRLHAGLVMGRKARVDCFQTAADLLDAGFELERALAVTARALGGKAAARGWSRRGPRRSRRGASRRRWPTPCRRRRR